MTGTVQESLMSKAKIKTTDEEHQSTEITQAARKLMGKTWSKRVLLIKQTRSLKG